MTFTMNGGAIADNWISYRGGGVYLYGEGVTGEMNGGVISNNRHGSNAIYGAAVYLAGLHAQAGSYQSQTYNGDTVRAKFTMNGGVMADNSTANTIGSYSVVDGTIYQDQYTTVTITDGVIANNSITAGGGVYMTGGWTSSNNFATCNMSGGYIGHNYMHYNTLDSDGSGGGIYAYNNCTVNMSGGTISDNHVYQGGGIYGHYYPTINMTGGTIKNNTTSYHGQGGGIFGEWYTTVNLSGGTISGNEAVNGQGGGVYAGYDSNTYSALNMTGGKITGNSASSGGGIYSALKSGSYTYEGKLVISDGEITENVAYADGEDDDESDDGLGGGVYAAYYVSMSGSPVIKDNTTLLTFRDVYGNETSEDNLYATNSSYEICLTGTLSEGAYVGVTTTSAVTVENPINVAYSSDTTYVSGSYSAIYSDMGASTRVNPTSDNYVQFYLDADTGTVTYQWNDGDNGPTEAEIEAAGLTLPTGESFLVGYNIDADEDLATLSTTSIATTRTIDGEEVSGKWIFTGWASLGGSDVMTEAGLTYVAQWAWRSEGREYTVYFCNSSDLGYGSTLSEESEFWIMVENEDGQNFELPGEDNSGIVKMTQVDGVLYSATFDNPFTKFYVLDKDSYDTETIKDTDYIVYEGLDWDDYGDDEYPILHQASTDETTVAECSSYTLPSDAVGTFYARVDLIDYLNDSRVASGAASGYSADNQGSEMEKGDAPFSYLNQLISRMAASSVGESGYTYTYPLYFGVFSYIDSRYAYGSSGKTSLYRWNSTANAVLETSWRSSNYSAAVQGLVGDTLVDGDGNEVDFTDLDLSYDAVGSWNIVDGTTGVELPYFSEDAANDLTYGGNKVMTHYENCKFPFIVSEVAGASEGVKKYSYSSATNYAVYLNYSTRVLEQSDHYVYNEDNPTRGFYPLNSLSNADGVNNDSGDAMNYGFGMKFTIPFTVNENGTIDGTEDGSAVTLSFTGDDDVWIFLDGKLVLDLGGIHARTVGTINFKTLTATAYNAASAGSYDGQTLTDGKSYNSGSYGSLSGGYVSAGMGIQHATPSTGTQTVSLADIFGEEYAETFQDSGQTHVFTMYYMERGMGDSNFAMDTTVNLLESNPTEDPAPEDEDVDPTPEDEDVTPTPENQTKITDDGDDATPIVTDDGDDATPIVTGEVTDGDIISTGGTTVGTQTGDDGHAALWMLLALICGAVAAGGAWRRRMCLCESSVTYYSPPTQGIAPRRGASRRRGRRGGQRPYRE